MANKLKKYILGAYIMFGYFSSIFVISIFLYSTHFSAMADRNRMSSDVFEDHISGQKALNPARATNATFAHENGLKGRTKTRKRLLAAVIDCRINSNLPHMKALQHQGLIHPDALSSNNPFMMTPEEELDQYYLIKEKLLNDKDALSNEHYDLTIKKYILNLLRNKINCSNRSSNCNNRSSDIIYL